MVYSPGTRAEPSLCATVALPFSSVVNVAVESSGKVTVNVAPAMGLPLLSCLAMVMDVSFFLLRTGVAVLSVVREVVERVRLQ